MGITFRHDAAAVALPTTNASGRKYGQQLVLQQQQQKYDAQQAQQDRMFDAYKMDAQNQVQQQRDWQQRDFVLNRDRDQNKLQQQQMEAARQQQFMDEARKQHTGMIMADIQNGEYDPNTSRKLQQNLVAESEALGNPQLDATQRAEALQKIRAERALLAANRMQKPPAPTPQEQFDQGVVNRNGVDYIQDSKGKWTPLEPSKAQQEQEKMIQQQELEAQKMRPMSAQEYYSQNEDKFQKDLDSTMKSMQSEYDAGTRKEAPTPEAAWEQMQKNHDFKQKALGKAQYGEPTLAKPYGQALGDAKRGAQNKEKGAQSSYDNLADMNDKLLELENRANSLPKGSKEAAAAWSAYRKERDRIINGDIPPAPEMKSIIDPAYNATPGVPASGKPTPTAPPATPPVQATPVPIQPTAPVATPQPAPSQNAWEQVAVPPSQATQQVPTPAQTNATQGNVGDASKYPWLRPPGQLMKGDKPQRGTRTITGAIGSSTRGSKPDPAQASPITMESASSAAKQYEELGPKLSSLQESEKSIAQQAARALSSGDKKTANRLAVEHSKVRSSIQSTQDAMQQAEKTVRGYYDQEIAKQPAVKKLAKAGKRPQDFAEAEFQLKNLRRQYPDMNSMPEEAKKQLKEAMAIIQAGR